MKASIKTALVPIRRMQLEHHKEHMEGEGESLSWEHVDKQVDKKCVVVVATTCAEKFQVPRIQKATQGLVRSVLGEYIQ